MEIVRHDDGEAELASVLLIVGNEVDMRTRYQAEQDTCLTKS